MTVQASQNTSTTGTSTQDVSRQSIAQNFDQFLTLLTAQLKNQNPLDPLNTNDFTSQLVQFASVEQQMKQNDSLAALVSKTDDSNTIGALQFVGKTVTAVGTNTALSNGHAHWVIDSSRSGTGTISVRDQNGRTIYKTTKALSGGAQDFEWDGTNTDGSKSDDGVNSIAVEGRTIDGSPLEIQTSISGVVDGLDLSTTPPSLKIGQLTLALNTLKKIST